MEYAQVDCFGMQQSTVVGVAAAAMAALVQKGRTAATVISHEQQVRFLEATITEFTTPERLSAIAEALVLATGRPYAEVYTVDILPVVECARYLLAAAEQTPEPSTSELGLFSLEGRYRTTIHQAQGLVAAAVPQNLPFSIPFMLMLRAVAHGNSIVVKCSPYAVAAYGVLQETLERIILASDLSPDTVQAVIGDQSCVYTLIDAQPDSFIFVGKTEHGRSVAEACGRALVPHVLELSTRNHAVVLEDADTAHAARGIVWGSFFAGGQTCATLAIAQVHTKQYDTFLSQITTLAESLRCGDPREASTDIGPWVQSDKGSLFLDTIATIKSDDAMRVVTGGDLITNANGVWCQPTVVVVDDEAALARIPEIAAPILFVSSFSTIEAALQRVKADTYCMHTSLWSTNVAAAASLASQCRSKQVFVNDSAYTYAVPSVPWDGVGASGYGSVGQSAAPAVFVRTTSVNVTPYDRNLSSWWYPYGPQHAAACTALIMRGR